MVVGVDEKQHFGVAGRWMLRVATDRHAEAEHLSEPVRREALDRGRGARCRAPIADSRSERAPRC